MMIKPTLNSLTCPKCGQTDTQAVDSFAQWHTGKKRRIRVDTVCQCGEIHYYTKHVNEGDPITIIQDDYLDIPF